MEIYDEPIKRKMREWTIDERKLYFREYYHKKITDADRHRVDKVINKQMVLEYLIEEVGIPKILQIYMNKINNDNKNIIE